MITEFKIVHCSDFVILNKEKKQIDITTENYFESTLLF